MNRTYFVFCILYFFLSANLPAEVIHHSYPRICPRSEDFRVFINDQQVDVYHTSAGNFVSFESDENVNVRVEFNSGMEEATILPRRLNIAAAKTDGALTFRLPAAEKILLETESMKQLFIYSNPVAREKPDPNAPGIHFFKSGQVYEIGKLNLKDNETLYIEGGAVVRGTVWATSAKNLTVGGYGVLDGGYFSMYGDRSHHMRFEDCREVNVNDIIMIEPPGWMLVLYHCEGVGISNIKQLGDGHGTDGIDIVASRKVRIENCMLRNGDDCIVVKSFQRDNRYNVPVLNTIQGPEDIVVRGCSVQSNGGGQAFEIGHELILNPVKNIRFLDCDVLGVHGQGGVFGIHNCDGATVSDVLYKDIRVDHYYNKLIDMRIIKSRWSRQDKVGFAKNITLENIRVRNSIYNPGYSISLIGGYDEDHQIENVIIKDFYIDDIKITDFDQLDLYLKQTKNIEIR